MVACLYVGSDEHGGGVTATMVDVILFIAVLFLAFSNKSRDACLSRDSFATFLLVELGQLTSCVSRDSFSMLLKIDTVRFLSLSLLLTALS